MLFRSVKIDLNQPMTEILATLAKNPIKTRLSLTGTMIVARDSAHAKLRERLEKGEPLPPKKSDEGDALRRRLLRRERVRDIDRWLTGLRIGSGARRDDVLDACAVAIAARDPAGHVPEGAVRLDRYGLPMQIWY